MKKFNFKDVSDFIGMDFDAYLITITKEDAINMLKASIGNRALKNANAESLRRDMDKDDYHYDTPGSGLAFNKDGKLCNGHHTLTAFIKSKLETITVVVFTGASHLDKCDTGQSRTLKDSAIMTGNEKYSELVKLALNILRIENNIAISNSGSRKEFPNSSIFNFCEKNYDELLKIASDIKDYKKRAKKDWGVGHYPKAEDSVIGALMWELAYIDGNDYELVKDYTFGLFTLNSHKNAVVDKFRKQIRKDSKLSNKNGAMHFTTFRSRYKDNFYKYLKTAVKTAM